MFSCWSTACCTLGGAMGNRNTTAALASNPGSRERPPISFWSQEEVFLTHQGRRTPAVTCPTACGPQRWEERAGDADAGDAARCVSSVAIRNQRGWLLMVVARFVRFPSREGETAAWFPVVLAGASLNFVARLTLQAAWLLGVRQQLLLCPIGSPTNPTAEWNTCSWLTVAERWRASFRP